MWIVFMGLYKFCPVSSFIKAAVTHYHRLGGLQTTKMFFPLFWSLEDQGHGAGRAGARQSLLPRAQCNAACVPRGRRGERSPRSLFFEDTITLEGSARMTRSRAKGPASKHHHFGS